MFKFEESIETTNIHSISGILPKDGSLVTERPFPSPHHTMSAVALAGSHSLDYLLMDQIAMEFYMSQDIFMDLRTFFSEDELEALKDDLVYMQTREDDMVPVALHIEDMPFAVDCIDLEDNIFLSFINNTRKKDVCRDFWEYLNNWEKK